MILNKTKIKIKRNFSLFYKDGDNIMYDQKTITTKCNTFLPTLEENHSEKIKIPMYNPFQSYLTGKHNNNFVFKI